MGIRWRDDLATGNETIDSQHRELLERFEILLTACKNGEGRQELSRLLGFLDDYVIMHFGDEEKLQRQSAFPGYNMHKEQHTGFIKQVSEVKKNIAQSGEIQLDHVLNTNKMLLDWLVQHISSSDRALGDHLRNKSF